MNRLISSVLVGLIGLNAVIQADPTKPRLVVGIMVDQLRTDYIDYLRELFGEKGFRMLADNSLSLRNVDFGVSRLDGPVAAAEVLTGTYPRTNGLTSALSASGNFSPDGLTVSTLADEIAIDGGGMANIYAIAPTEAMAIALAGHSANGAIWLDPNNGQWASSSYYGSLPGVIDLKSGRKSIASRIDTMAWKPSIPIERYPGVAPQKKFYPFRYSFPKTDRDLYRKFARTPLMNSEVTDLAIDFIHSLKLGNRGSDATDMLGIGLTAAPYKEASDGSHRLELADSYLRLDSQLSRLFKAIDEEVGLDKTLIFVSGTGYCDEAITDDPKFRIPGGELSLKKMRSLLNSYLSAKYGNGDYIKSVSEGELKFNDKIIEDKRLSKSDVMTEARSFLSRMSGVSQVLTLDEILAGVSPEARALRLSIDSQSAPDLMIEYQPGWRVTDDQTYPVTHKVIRSNAVASPIFIMGPGVNPETISTAVDATTLAATIAGILRIRSPNAASKPFQ